MQSKVVTSAPPPDPAVADEATDLPRLIEASLARARHHPLAQGARSAIDRLETALRTVALDRRKLPRFPFAAEVEMTLADRSSQTLTLDVSALGLMLDRPTGLRPQVNQPVGLRIADVGEFSGVLVGFGRDTLSVRLDESGAGPAQARLSELIASLAQANADGLAAATRLAQEVAGAMEDGLRHGDVGVDELFGGALAPIPDTDPLQHSHPALGFLTRVLPPILARHHEIERRMVYAVATEQRGYVPVHNARFSQPQRAGDRAFNIKFARDRRIYADRWTLKAARFSRGPVVQTARRDVPKGHGRLVRDYASPIIVAGCRWGAAQIGYSLD